LLLGGRPVPDSSTICGPPAALSMIVRVPVCGVVFGGLKVTDTLQLLPGLSFFRHCDFIANAPGVTLSIWMVRGRPVFFLPRFLITSVFGLLVFPTVVFVPNASVGGLRLGGKGAGVAVGVALGVAVAVAVAVRVAVAVAVAVRVGVPDDAVAVAVEVAVAVAVDVTVGVAV